MRAWPLLLVCLLFVSLVSATTTTISFDGTSYINQTGITVWTEGSYIFDNPNGISLITMGKAPNRVLGFHNGPTVPNQSNYLSFGRLSSGPFALRYLEYWNLAASITIYAIRGIQVNGSVTIPATTDSTPHAFYFPTDGTFDCITNVAIVIQSLDLTNMIYLDNIVVENCTGCNSSPCVPSPPAPVSRPSTLVVASSGNVFFRRPSDNGAEQIQFNGGSFIGAPYNIWTNLAPGAIPAAGNINAISNTTQQHIFYRNTAGKLGHIYQNGANYYYDNYGTTGQVLGDPTSLFDSLLHVYYRGIGNHVNHVFWTGSVYYPDQWDVLAGAGPLAVGSPVAIFALGQQHVFYRSAEGHINHIYWWVGQANVTFDRWTYLTNAPMAAGDPTVLINGNQLNVFYRDVDGFVRRIYWDSTGFHYDPWSTNAPGAALAVGDIAAAVYYGALGPELHTFYRSSYGTITHIWFNGSTPYGTDVWNVPATAVAGGDPATMAIASEQHMFYLDAGSLLRHVWWNGTLTGEVWPNPI